MAILEADQLQIPILSLVDFNILDPLRKYKFNQIFFSGVPKASITSL
jgi:hypothetical protein